MKRILIAVFLVFLFTFTAFAESGDLNTDGEENLLDCLIIAKQIVSENETQTADINGDGKLNMQDILILIKRVTNDPQKTMSPLGNEHTFTVKNGSWTYKNGILTGNNASTAGDCFATSDVYISAGTAFEIEATLQIVDGTGQCGGVMFGVQAPERPNQGWYCVNVDKKNKKTRLFSVNLGTVGTSSTAQRPLTEEELAKDSFTVRIACTESGLISYWLDGEFVASIAEPKFIGGYLGFNTYTSKVIFSDISVRVGECSLPEQNIYTPTSGTWSYLGGMLSGKNASLGDAFAMTDIYVPSKTAFSVEATYDMKSGSKAGGIVFGVGNPKKPSAGWYCANLTTSKSSARIFAVNTGTIGSAADTYYPLTEEQLAETPYRMRLEVSAEGKLSLYVNGTLAAEDLEPNFAGGYIGFNTYKTDGVFKDISITVDGKPVPLSTSTLSAGDLQIPLNLAATYQTVNLGDYDGEVTVSLDIPSGYTASVGTELLKNNTYVFTPANARSRVQFDLRDAYARKTSLVLEVKRDVPEELIYTDEYRPKYHITPPEEFMNDPNGLHYNALTGEYHAYYQWRTVEEFGKVVWRHAVSTDLLNWKDQGVVIEKGDGKGDIWSGSAVVDKDNTSGLFDESVAPENRIVAFYTCTGPFTQDIAYSTDGGYTFTKYEGNPVISSSAYFSQFRDPKVQWIEEKGLWLMVVAGGPMELYTSPDLINWTSHGTMKYYDGTTIESECPMLIALPLDGDENNIKYVYVGSGRFYVVGDLVWEGDSVRFVAEQRRINDPYLAAPHYATQDFFGDANGRVLAMSWMREYISMGSIDDKNWLGIQSLPYECALVTKNGQMVLESRPIAELENIRGETLYSVTDMTAKDEALPLDDVEAKYSLIDLSAKLTEGASIQLALREGEDCASTFTCTYLSPSTVSVKMNTKNSGIYPRTEKTATVQCDEDGTFSLKILLDNSVLEAFTSDGQVFADFIFPFEDANGMSLHVDGEAHIASFTVSATK